MKPSSRPQLIFLVSVLVTAAWVPGTLANVCPIDACGVTNPFVKNDRQMYAKKKAAPSRKQRGSAAGYFPIRVYNHTSVELIVEVYDDECKSTAAYFNLPAGESESVEICRNDSGGNVTIRRSDMVTGEELEVLQLRRLSPGHRIDIR